MKIFNARETKKSNLLWLDLGDLGDLVNPAGPHEQWQDHGLGLLRTILHQEGVMTDMFSTRQHTNWDDVRKKMQGYDMLIMNVRSYTYPAAYRAAKLFKEVNPKGIVVAGGMHATVALDEMLAVPEFDRICQGPGEKT
ncbi:MAG TPA: cobalamin-dependent protein, partial [Anaerolineae bacterium]